MLSCFPLRRFPYPALLSVTSLVAASLCVTPAAFASKDSVPDWVRAAAVQPLPEYSKETSAVVLLDDTTFTVASDGKAVQHTRHVIKILRPNGREEAVARVDYNNDSKILSMHVWSIGPDGHEYALKDNEITDYGYPGSGGVYSDDRFKVAHAPGADPGGIVAYEYEQRAPAYLHQTTWEFQDDIPHVSQSFTLELPPGFTYSTTWAHHDQTKAIDLEHQRYRWEMNAMPGIDLDHVAMRPAYGALAGRMTINYAASGETDVPLGSWQGMGVWFDKLSRDRVIPTPEIAAKAAQLTAGKTGFYETAEAIGDFVQKDIRYFALELGVGGQQPHPAADIFRNRYGDCKDKAALLSAMLSTVGIHSAIMIVDTNRGVIDPAAPSIIGNHAIGAIEIPKGYENPHMKSVVLAKNGRRYLIFDPTWDKTPFGQLEANLQGSYGMLMEAKDSEIVELPVLSPELNTIKRTAKMQLQPDGSLKGSITEARFGDLAERTRELYTDGDAKQQSNYLDRVLARDFLAFTVADVKVENVAALNKDVTTSYSLSAERYGRTMGPLLMLRPRVLGSEGFEIDLKTRKVPIDLSETMIATDDFTIELPAGYLIDELPDPVKMDMGFAAYESSSKMDGNSLHYTRTYTVRQVTLPAERYSELKKLAAAINADEQNQAVLKKK